MQRSASDLDAQQYERLFRAGLADAQRWGRPAAGGSSGAPGVETAANAGAGIDAILGGRVYLDSLAGYEKLREIHRGGQGVVYQAVQRSTNRRVAIKVLRRSQNESERKRFVRESFLLSELRHSNIVAVHDAGEVGDCHYIVMDYVDGVPIDAYVEGRRDGGQSPSAGSSDRAGRRQSKIQSPKSRIEAVLRLFATVCDAVNVAHLKGVIHRDLKPANILVDASGEPRVLDFGLAKSLNELDDATLTQAGQFVGTVAWASPEQAAGRNAEVDARTDVYALGVILYQLLTGSFPYEVRGPMRDTLNNIVSVEPARPRAAVVQSSALSIVRAEKQSGALRSPIDDELETIVLKCLAKGPARRYQSAGELAADIRHYLAGEPIEAKRDSAWYVLRKTLQRHRGAVAIAAAFLLLLVAGSVVSTVFWQHAEHARDAESDQRARAEAINEFMKDMLTAAEPARAKGPKLTVREALDTAAKGLDERPLKDQPLVEAEIRFTIGSTYFSLGLYPEAETQLRAADALQSRELGDEHPDTLRTRSKLADTLVEKTDYAGAALIAEPTLEAQNRVLGPNHPDTLQSMVVLGKALAVLNRFPEGESLLRAAIERRRRAPGGQDHTETADAMDWLGFAYILNNYEEKAEPLHREAMRINSYALGNEHPATLRSMKFLACALLNQIRPEEAEAIYRGALEPSVRVLGPDHIYTLGLQAELAGAVHEQGRHAEAETMFRGCLAAHLRTVGPADRATINTQRNLARCLVRQGNYPGAEMLVREALDLAREKYGPEHGDTCIRLMCLLAEVLAAQREDAEAEQVARQVLVFQHRQRPRAHPAELSQSSAALIEVLQRRGASDEALRIEQELIESWLAEAHQPDASPQILNDAARALLFPKNEKLRDAPQALELALRANERSGHQNPRHLRTLATAYRRTGDSERFTQVWEQAYALLPNDESRAAMLNDTALGRLNATPETLRNPAEAVQLALRANELSEYKNPAHLDTLAQAYLMTGNSGRACDVWEQASGLSPDDPSRAKMLNGAAWKLLTAAPETLRDHAGALKLALRANGFSAYKNPAHLDTLALAHFRTGDTSKAIEFQKKALDLLPQDSSQRADYEAPLSEFEAALEKSGGKNGTP